MHVCEAISAILSFMPEIIVMQIRKVNRDYNSLSFCSVSIYMMATGFSVYKYTVLCYPP